MLANSPKKEQKKSDNRRQAEYFSARGFFRRNRLNVHPMDLLLKA